MTKLSLCSQDSIYLEFNEIRLSRSPLLFALYIRSNDIDV